MGYVDCSKQYRYCNLEGNNLLLEEVNKDSDSPINPYNFSTAYWERESNENYKKLIRDFEDGKFQYVRHPKDISLRFFMADFSVKWEYEGFDFVPIPHPCYKWVVHKSKEQYEKYCRSLLLMEKPGCYLSNIGTEFDSCEAELKDFVENSEFCSN